MEGKSWGWGPRTKLNGAVKEGERSKLNSLTFQRTPGTTLFVRLFIVTLFETLQLSLCLVFFRFLFPVIINNKTKLN